MSSATNASDGDGDSDTETSPCAGIKTHHNLSIVYIDHDLDKPSAESTDDEASSGTSLAVVYIDHHMDGFVPSDINQGPVVSSILTAQDTVARCGQGLFRLPPELRIMIWELILPGTRLLRARAWYGRNGNNRLDNGSSQIKGRHGRWYFRVYKWVIGDFEGYFLRFRVPTVLKICRESRNVALRHGSFIFGQRDKSRETGIWWNPKLDVLGFDHSWDLEGHPWALAHLHGLEHVKRVAIDERHAWTLCYRAGYNGDYPLDIPRELREPLAVVFEFRESDDRNHFILEFFPHFQQLKIIFSTIYNKICREALNRHPINFDWDSIDENAYSVTFRLGSDIQTAAKELRKYRDLCMQTKVREPDWDQLDELVDGPVYSVKDADVDVDHLDHWMGAGFAMCQADEEVPI